MPPYQVLRAPRHEKLHLRGLSTHVTRWGPAPAAGESPVFLLHGWQDTGDTFQFMVDQFRGEWPLLAIDWRGFGRSEWPREGYWFPDYFADLDALLELLSPQAPARLVGHSMGGNVAGQYAGLRPDRVRCLVNLEGVGLPRTSPDSTPALIRQWLAQVRSGADLKRYDSLERLTAVIRFRYPRFAESQAAFVAAAWSEPEAGGVRLLGDPRHRWVNPVRYQRDDAEAIWRQVTAPTLMVLGEVSEIIQKTGLAEMEAAFRRIIPHVELARIPDAGHMLHIERADLVAPVVEAFLEAHSAGREHARVGHDPAQPGRR